jgi:HlyD family secretion protein
MKNPALLRLFLPWIAAAAVVGIAVYKLQVEPAPALVPGVPKSDFGGDVMGTGTLDARVRTTVSSRIQERLAEVLVDQGDRVKAGQILARLDDAEILQQVAIADATVASANLTSTRVKTDLTRSEAVLSQAILNHQRLTGLLVSRAVSQADTDKAGEELRVAEADLKHANAAIAEAQSQILVAEKTLLYRKEQLAYTRILAPYNGLIIRRDREAGDMLVPGGSLLEMISLDEIWVSAWVDETAISKVAKGQTARILFRSEKGKSYPGVVSRIGRETDRETREFLVDVRVNELPKNWTIGQRAEVYIKSP